MTLAEQWFSWNEVWGWMLAAFVGGFLSGHCVGYCAWREKPKP